MPRKANIHGGGANTNLNGLTFEKRTDFKTSLNEHPKIIIEEKIGFYEIYYKNKLQGFYTESMLLQFLKKEQVKWD